MSAEATFWAWEQEVKATHKLVLLSLANCHNESTGKCNPSIQYLARKTGLDRKTVMSAVAELEKSGLIIPSKTYGTSNSYRLKTSTKNGTGTNLGTSTKNGTAPVPKTGLLPVPKTGHKSKRESKKNLKVYAYDGETIRLTESDYQKIAKQYPHLDLNYHLDQLDLELRGKKNWFMALNAKLNYRNRGDEKRQQLNQPRSAVDRVNQAISERARQREQALQREGRTINGDGVIVETDDRAVRPQVDKRERLSADGGMGSGVSRLDC